MEARLNASLKFRVPVPARPTELSLLPSSLCYFFSLSQYPFPPHFKVKFHERFFLATWTLTKVALLSFCYLFSTTGKEVPWGTLSFCFCIPFTVRPKNMVFLFYCLQFASSILLFPKQKLSKVLKHMNTNQLITN